MKKKIKSNVDLVTNYMEWGSAMNQIFLIDAISKHAKMVVDNEEQVLKDMENSFVYGPSWIQCAKDWINQSNEFYSRDIRKGQEEEEEEEEDEIDDDTLLEWFDNLSDNKQLNILLDANLVENTDLVEYLKPLYKKLNL